MFTDANLQNMSFDTEFEGKSYSPGLSPNLISFTNQRLQITVWLEKMIQSRQEHVEMTEFVQDSIQCFVVFFHGRSVHDYNTWRMVVFHIVNSPHLANCSKNVKGGFDSCYSIRNSLDLHLATFHPTARIGPSLDPVYQFGTSWTISQQFYRNRFSFLIIRPSQWIFI